MVDVSVIILTYNEEKNLAHALDSVIGWAKEMFILDSLSTDGTVEIAKERGCTVIQHHWRITGSQGIMQKIL